LPGKNLKDTFLMVETSYWDLCRMFNFVQVQGRRKF